MGSNKILSRTTNYWIGFQIRKTSRICFLGDYRIRIHSLDDEWGEGDGEEEFYDVNEDLPFGPDMLNHETEATAANARFDFPALLPTWVRLLRCDLEKLPLFFALWEGGGGI